ncbi:MAG: hypothetical protein ABH811_00195 [archaeon]
MLDKGSVGIGIIIAVVTLLSIGGGVLLFRSGESFDESKVIEVNSNIESYKIESNFQIDFDIGFQGIQSSRNFNKMETTGYVDLKNKRLILERMQSGIEVEIEDGKEKTDDSSYRGKMLVENNQVTVEGSNFDSDVEDISGLDKFEVVWSKQQDYLFKLLGMVEETEIESKKMDGKYLVVTYKPPYESFLDFVDPQYFSMAEDVIEEHYLKIWIDKNNFVVKDEFFMNVSFDYSGASMDLMMHLINERTEINKYFSDKVFEI